MRGKGAVIVFLCGIGLSGWAGQEARAQSPAGSDKAAAPATQPRTPLSIAKWTSDKVRAAFGPPTRSQLDVDGLERWYYTAKGEVQIFLAGDQVMGWIPVEFQFERLLNAAPTTARSTASGVAPAPTTAAAAPARADSPAPSSTVPPRTSGTPVQIVQASVEAGPSGAPAVSASSTVTLRPAASPINRTPSATVNSEALAPTSIQPPAGDVTAASRPAEVAPPSTPRPTAPAPPPASSLPAPVSVPPAASPSTPALNATAHAAKVSASIGGLTTSQLREIAGAPVHTESTPDGLVTLTFSAPSGGSVRVFSREGKVVGWSPLDFQFDTLRSGASVNSPPAPITSAPGAARAPSTTPAAASAATTAVPNPPVPGALPTEFQAWDAPPVKRK